MKQIQYEISYLDRNDHNPKNWKLVKEIIEVPDQNAAISESMVHELSAQRVCFQPFEYTTKNGHEAKTDNLEYALKRKNKHAVRAVVNNLSSKELNKRDGWLYWRVYSDDEYAQYYAKNEA